MGHILFAEDNAISQELVKEILEIQGYDVQVASNGTDALAMALADKPDLMLLDVRMPYKTGLEVTLAVKTHYGDEAPPVILITALGTIDDIEQGRQSGADDYIIKPFSPDALHEKIQACLQVGP